MEFDFDDDPARCLRGYVRTVGEALGLRGECFCVQVEPASAYLPLDGHVAMFPDRDVALLWDEQRGWSVAVELGAGEDLVVVAHLGGDVLPPPSRVARWVERLLRDGQVPASAPPLPRPAADDLPRRLAPYASATGPCAT
ncbi:DUF6292 family protein [Saccharothrix coeruleofusca]|uniref:DUF6292 family protein n=1 Tax=Saccharothrix coeruleofusca TaxID=33919 RepID=UPI001AEAF3F6|nr:DUF6292 family protein [Saccharothrix coeruleofusca]